MAHTHAELSRLRVAELRTLLEKAGLATDGLKAALIERLLSQQEGEAKVEVKEGASDAAPAAAKKRKASEVEWETEAEIAARKAALTQRRAKTSTGIRTQSTAEELRKSDGISPSLSAGAITVSKRNWRTEPGQKRHRTAPGTTTGAKGGKRSWAKKEALRAEIRHVRDMAKEMRDEKEAEKEAEKDRLRNRRKKREENARKAMVTQTITNPHTIKRMTRKQLRSVTKI